MENIFFDDFPLFQICNPILVENQEHASDVSIGNQRLINSIESQEHLLNVLKENWERDKKLSTITMLCYTVHMLYFLKVMAKKVDKPIRDHIIGREEIRTTLLRQLRETNRCRDILRMSSHAFLELCAKLRATGHVKDTIHVTVEEQVARFLYIIGHNVKNRTISFFFHRSGETISRNFHAVLRAVISLEEEFLQQPSGTTIPSEILRSNRFYPYFKDCIGAIDGTHVRVKVPIADQPRFRGRKEWPTQNVLAACGFDMRFTYALAGWEGTASDSKVLKSALSRDDRLKIPRGKFYFGDAGFMLKHALITPYRGVRYHLKEFAGREPENAYELFNLRHSSLRNVIERSFGVLKKRFAIIAGGTEPYYDVEVMVDIVLACIILHNFLMGVDPDQHLISQVDRELQNNNPEATNEEREEVNEDYRRGAALRDNMAAQIWADYQIER
ncbi:hypothetical protein AHAS_Ahas12G0132600 [Arachis hypogaea]